MLKLSTLTISALAAMGSGAAAPSVAQPYTGISGAPDFVVNQYLTYAQQHPRVAALNGGGFAIVWEDLVSIDGSVMPREIVKARIFETSGVPRTNEFVVNTQTDGAQFTPDVTALNNGGFVAVWHDERSRADDPDGYAIRGQRFTSAGAKSGSEFLVNTTTAGRQVAPSVATLTGGRFVVAWGDGSHDAGPGDVVRVQIFAAADNGADGGRIGLEFKANATAAGADPWGLPKIAPHVVPLTGGGFVVSWSGEHTSGDDVQGRSVRMVGFDQGGAAQSGEIGVNSTHPFDQHSPSGERLGPHFALVWADQTAATSGATRILARSYDGIAQALTPQAYVDPAVFGDSNRPRMAARPGDGALIAYSGSAIMGRAVRADLQPEGPEFQINTSVANVQFPDVAHLGGDTYVATWTYFGGGDATDVRARIFTLATNAPADGIIKICKVAGAGVAPERNFTFSDGTRTLKVPAGPAPHGYCSVLGTSYVMGAKVSVTETGPAGPVASEIAVVPASRLASPIDLAGKTAVVTVGPGVTEIRFRNDYPTGFIEICKEGPAEGRFTFSFEGADGPMSVEVPAGACSPAIKVPASDNFKIVEAQKAGSAMNGGRTIPSTRLVSNNFNTRTMRVKVVAGDVTSQTIVYFRNKPSGGAGGSGAGAALAPPAPAKNSASGEPIRRALLRAAPRSAQGPSGGVAEGIYRSGDAAPDDNAAAALNAAEAQSLVMDHRYTEEGEDQ